MTYYTKNEDGTFSEVFPDPANFNDIPLDQDQSDGPKSAPDEDFDTYVHLADGSVERVTAHESQGVGTNAPHGHFERDGKLYQVIGVYPRENKVS